MADKVLIVEDNETLRAGIKVYLEDAGFSIDEAATGVDAVKKLEAESFHAVVSDIRLGDLTGVDILKKAKEVNSRTEVILMTAYATVETAVEALRLGAFDYIQKPLELEQLKHRVRTAIKMGKMLGELEVYQRAEYRNALEDGALVAESGGMKGILSVIRKVSPTTATILITGETGTGKELVAEAIHRTSGRAGGFVPLNCGTLSGELAASELFGHEKGSFTGAMRRHVGAFERASGGTLFLDELAEMPIGLQPHFLRAVETGKVQPVGAER
ncbi:MAG: sigma-54-dependent transcriptional regulator, partial [Deltaproteobacteria bacterium]